MNWHFFLPSLDVLLVVNLSEEFDFDDLQNKEDVAEVGGRIGCLADLLDSLSAQTRYCAH